MHNELGRWVLYRRLCDPLKGVLRDAAESIAYRRTLKVSRSNVKRRGGFPLGW